MYGMIHTLITIMYALSISSRYGSNPGPRHIEFLKHLLMYCKYAKLDRLNFATHDGLTDMKTMTQVLRLNFLTYSTSGLAYAVKVIPLSSHLGHCLYVCGSIVCWELQSIQLCILAILEEVLEKLDMPRTRVVTIS